MSRGAEAKESRPTDDWLSTIMWTSLAVVVIMNINDPTGAGWRALHLSAAAVFLGLALWRVVRWVRARRANPEPRAEN